MTPPLSILRQTLDDALPFAAVVAAGGQLLHIGRSLAKTLDGMPKQGRFFDLFRVRAPRALRDRQDLDALCGHKLTLETTRQVNGRPVRLRATLARSDPDRGEYLLVTSLGTELPRLIAPLGLTARDFAHADSSIDMLYVLKAQTELIRDTQALATRLQRAKEAAEAQALTDPMTGLPNRRAMNGFAKQLMSAAAVAPDRAWLLHIDLDRFKLVNDRLGHAAGDAILRSVASELRQVAGPDDLPARIGGDEFILIVSGPMTQDAVRALAQRLIARISTPLDFGGQPAEVGASIGITAIPGDRSKSLDSLLLEADLALYDVKGGGRGMVKFFSGEMRAREAVIQELIRDIEPAILRGEFQPYFQPQVDAVTGRLTGAEVLGRWDHPRHGLIPPARFLYVAERARLVEVIDTAVYDSALDWLAMWKDEGIAPPHISLNVTARQLVHPSFVDWMLISVAQRGLVPSDVTFELVETILFDGEADDVRHAVRRLTDEGFGVAIDDFGTGTASITSLIAAPVSLVKIDRTFVTGLDAAPRLRLLTQAIVEICRKLDLDVLAEGVETPQEAAALCAMGCEVLQGYLISHPLAAENFAEWLRDESWRAVLDQLRMAAPDAAATG